MEQPKYVPKQSGQEPSKQLVLNISFFNDNRLVAEDKRVLISKFLNVIRNIKSLIPQV